MSCLVPVGHFRNISGHLFTWLVCGSFQWRHGLLFTDCIVWDDKDKVIGFKRSHWIHLGWWSTGSPKLQPFQFWQHSHVTNRRLISFSAFFPWNMTLKYKMQLSGGSWDKILHSKSRTRCSSKEGVFFVLFFWRFVARSDTPKFRKQFSRLLCKDYRGKLKTLLEPLHRLSTYSVGSWLTRIVQQGSQAK